MCLPIHKQGYSAVSIINPKLINIFFPCIYTGEMYLGRSHRGEWCRVQVKNVDPAGITVLYIDTGNVERIPQNW